MSRYPNLLPALMTVSLLQTSVVQTQDVLTITTSLPYVINGAWQYDLTCTVSPLKAMTFRWEGIVCNQREKLLGGDRCTFTPSQSNNGKTVMCIASYGTNGSEISNIATLNVLYPPSTPPDITTNIIGDTMYVGHAYQLVCTIRGGNPLPTMYFGCAPTSPFHQGVTHWKDGYSYTLYDINPAVLSDNCGVCKCTGRWSPQPDVYPLSASVTLRAAELNGSTVPCPTVTTSTSEKLTFTPRTSSLTSSETIIPDQTGSVLPDLKQNDSGASAGIGVGVAVVLVFIAIGVIAGRKYLNSLKAETRPKIPVSASLGSCVSYSCSSNSLASLCFCEEMKTSETSEPPSLDSNITGDEEILVQNIYISKPPEPAIPLRFLTPVHVPASSGHPNATNTM